MAAIGWLATGLTEAEAYFSGERLNSAAWTALGTDAKKTAALTQAYNRIRRCADFDIPAAADLTAAQTSALAEAQLETAYYLAQHGADEDVRKGLQAQGVNSAQVVKEGYADADLHTTPLPSNVYDILSEFVSAKPFYAVEIGRDENKGITEDCTDEEELDY